jgi:hypothetical protein
MGKKSPAINVTNVQKGKKSKEIFDKPEFQYAVTPVEENKIKSTEIAKKAKLLGDIMKNIK